MLNRKKWRFNTLALAIAMVLICTATFVHPAMADEAKSNVMPPMSGEGAGQTYAQAVWVMIIFVILLAILYPTAWKNVLVGLKKREDKIRAAIAEADAARIKGEASLKEFNVQLANAETTANTIRSKAVQEAEQLAAGIRARAQQEAEEIKEQAMKEIESSKRQALSEIYDQSAELATSIAEKILRRNLNPDDQKDLVRQSLDELQAVHV